jgi:hypothetical protein
MSFLLKTPDRQVLYRNCEIFLPPFCFSDKGYAMKAIPCVPQVVTTVAWADEATDSAGIDRVISHMNDGVTTDERSDQENPAGACRA